MAVSAGERTVNRAPKGSSEHLMRLMCRRHVHGAVNAPSWQPPILQTSNSFEPPSDEKKAGT